jgi:hypothetical protein
MQTSPFTLYRVENVITEESAEHGDYDSSEATPTENADFRDALVALDSDCWDNVDVRQDGTIIAYPADYTQNYRTGAYEGSELIINSRKPHWGIRLYDFWSARNSRARA